MYCGEVTKEVAKGKNELRQMTTNAFYKNKEDVIQEFWNYIYGKALPFNLVKNHLFIQMLKVVREYRKGLKPPFNHEVRVSYLKKVVYKVQKNV